ncbi:MAG: hypothetical protein WDO24_30765 [Pseudomonadota bacterium]
MLDDTPLEDREHLGQLDALLELDQHVLARLDGAGAARAVM